MFFFNLFDKVCKVTTFFWEFQLQLFIRNNCFFEVPLLMENFGQSFGNDAWAKLFAAFHGLFWGVKFPLGPADARAFFDELVDEVFCLGLLQYPVVFGEGASAVEPIKKAFWRWVGSR